MIKHGHIAIPHDQLSAKCNNCNATDGYKEGGYYKLDKWKKALIKFTWDHKLCVK